MVIVEGGPGTGKSVVAVNLLATLIERRMNARYVSKNRAPRQVIEHTLAGVLKRSKISMPRPRRNRRSLVDAKKPYPSDSSGTSRSEPRREVPRRQCEPRVYADGFVPTGSGRT